MEEGRVFDGRGLINLSAVHLGRKEAINSSKYSSTDMVLAITCSVVETDLVDWF
jgi:hypothetical protein